MKKKLQLIILSYLLLFMNCASVYWKDRKQDALDIFDLTVTPPILFLQDYDFKKMANPIRYSAAFRLQLGIINLSAEAENLTYFGLKSGTFGYHKKNLIKGFFSEQIGGWYSDGYEHKIAWRGKEKNESVINLKNHIENYTQGAFAIPYIHFGFNPGELLD
ncbi:MAG TPA: hypothetical protein PLS71_20050, partial [Leptospiraceae bacterium]|nr:hypothetical protein [Leptospiraceae bacterium]